MPVLPIEERAALTPEEFNSSFLLDHRPVIIRCAVAHWPAVHKWAPEYLRQMVEGAKVVVKSKSDYGMNGSKRHAEESKELDFAEVVDMMTDDHAPDMSYVRQTKVWKDIEQLVADVDRLEYAPANVSKTDGNLWIGPPGTVAQMHWDPAHNLYAQIRGEKKWIVVSPSESHMTYGNKFSLADIVQDARIRARFPGLIQTIENFTHSSGSMEDLIHTHLDESQRSLIHSLLAQVNNCDVDAENPDPQRTPLFLEAHRYEATLTAGDLMFIPYSWRHYVRAITPSVSLNWFFRPEHSSATARSVNQTLLEHLICAS
ncbi:MAG TPA: cupin-like domain-containing protein [Candidatus Angelobacter sp.]|jgi:jumonji domain-containing protein 7|nr:cupin-like domain-containing protein [Candidatus Angelobacter sp.]